MISTTIETYLETLAGYIFDDDKLVTYKWLSKELGLHVNFSKQILWQFLKEHNNPKKLLATFTLMGHLHDGTLRVEVVKESDLSSAKLKYSKLTSEHLYSLQRALPDIELLALTGAGDHRQAAITCKEVKPRKKEELLVLRWGLKPVDEKAVNSADKSSKSNSKETPANPKPKTAKNSLANIFGKINNSDKSEPKREKDAALARGKKRQGSEDPGVNVDSKRQKRKLEADSRSSEESSGNEEEDLEMDCAVPEAEAPSDKVVPPSPPKYKIEKGKRKVRKVVDKTSTDSNGYFVTNKEYVYETCSEGEEVAETPKIDDKKPQAVAKANRKQASLLNFFKKS